MTALVPALLMLLFGVVGLDRQAWRDEHATWRAATLPWDAFGAHLSQMDIVLSPYYLFMRGWIFVFGDSVISMRLPSVLAMACAAGLTAVLGQRLFGYWAGLAGGCLFAVVPSVSRFAQEARPYAFAVAFAAASLLALLARRWWLVSLMVALTGLAHMVALLVLLAHLPVVARNPYFREVGASGGEEGPTFRKLGLRWIIAVGVGLVPVAPVAILGTRQTGQVSWINPSLRSLALLPWTLARSAAVAGLLAILAIAGVFVRGWNWRVTMLCVWAFGPPVVLFVLAHNLFYYRYLLFVLPAWTIAAGLALRKPAVVGGVVVVALLAGAHAQLMLRRSPLPGDQDYRRAAAYVAEHMSPSDGIRFLWYPNRERLGFAYELRHRAMPVECKDCAHRMWLVSNHSHAKALRGYKVVETKRFSGITLTLLSR